MAEPEVGQKRASSMTARTITAVNMMCSSDKIGRSAVDTSHRQEEDAGPLRLEGRSSEAKIN